MKRYYLIIIVFFIFILVGCKQESEVTSQQKEIYQLAVEVGYEGTFEEWLDSIKGEQGIPGENVELSAKDGYIKWKNTNDNEWYNLVSLEQLAGIDGTNGKEVTFKIDNDYIKWQYIGESTWKDLVSISLLVGPGGKNGIDGKQTEFRVNNNLLQWRYLGDIDWINIFDLSSLKGKNGTDGVNGITPHIGVNGNWFIGTLDTKVNAIGQAGTNGITPHIGENGNWWIGEQDTEISATIAVDNMDRIGTDGLYFDLTIRNGIAGYEVTGYSGTSKDIIIPNEIFGQKVISIKQGSLPSSITSLSISKYTELLPNFQNYNYLRSFDFNNAPVSTIPANAFRDAINLTTITNYQNVKNVGSYSFYNTQILFTGFDFTNIQTIGDYAFYISSISNYEVGDGVIVIEKNDAIEISNQTFIYLPDTVTTIGSNAFPLEYSIYYGGNSQVSFTSEYFFKNVKQTEDGYWYVDRNTYVGLLNYTGDLTEIKVPSQIDGKNVNVVENFAFIGNNSLSRIDLPNTVTSIGNYSFVLTRKLYILTIPSSIVNLSNSYFAPWYDFGCTAEIETQIDFPAPVVVFENNQSDINFGNNSVEYYEWGRYAFGYNSSQIKQDSGFVYLEKAASAEILAIKNAKGKVTIPSTYNSKPISRLNKYSLVGPNGGVVLVDISNGVEFISTNAFFMSNLLRYVNIPSSVSAVNYQGFKNLPNLFIYTSISSRPSNWDSSWYSNIGNVYWGSSLTVNVSSDSLYIYELNSGTAKILKYLGEWNLTTPLIIPELLDGKSVTAIGTNAISNTTSTSTLEVVIPKSILTISSRAITYYRYLKVYSNLSSKPTGWSSDYSYSSYYGYYSESYITYYWNDSWTLINNVPVAK